MLYKLWLRILGMYSVFTLKQPNRIKANIYGLLSLTVMKDGRLDIQTGTIISNHMFALLGGVKTKLYVGRHAKLMIGKNIQMTNTSIVCLKSITIGDNVLIGAEVLIMDSDFHELNYAIRKDQKDVGVNKKIEIDSGVFIGARSIILKGVHIGEGSVIASGSVVTKNVPSAQIWGGSPAKFIRNV